MEEAVEEHHSKSISFSLMVEDDSSKHRTPRRGDTSGIRNALEMETRNFQIPTVTISPKTRRQGRRMERRCCHWLCMFRIIVLLLPLVYYKEIGGILSMVPQSVVSTAIIKHDYSSVRSAHDLNSEIVRPKCFKHIIDCPCQDPLVPTKEEGFDWDETFRQNKMIASSERARNARVVFYGDSITEGWRGTQFGRERPRVDGVSMVFDTFFSRDTGAIIDGVALGLAGDKTNNLLFRLQNGELPASLTPSVFWVLIGTNDIGNTFCSPEMVVVGVLRVVEEILIRRPNSHVVLNGLLPRTFNQDGFVARGGKLKPSLWQELKTINGELKLYATYRERVSYFDTNLFFKNPGAHESELQIDKDLMGDYLHPTPKGYQLWGQEISEKLLRLIPDL